MGKEREVKQDERIQSVPLPLPDPLVLTVLKTNWPGGAYWECPRLLSSCVHLFKRNKKEAASESLMLCVRGWGGCHCFFMFACVSYLVGKKEEAGDLVNSGVQKNKISLHCWIFGSMGTSGLKHPINSKPNLHHGVMGLGGVKE